MKKSTTQNNDNEVVTKGYLRQEFAKHSDEISRRVINEVGILLGEFMQLIDARFEKQDQRFDRMERMLDRHSRRQRHSENMLDDHEVRIEYLENHTVRP